MLACRVLYSSTRAVRKKINMASSSAHPLDGLKIGFIGAGMMASAMIRGLIAQGIPAASIFACDLDQGSLDRLALPVTNTFLRDASSVANKADVIVIAVKPYGVVPVLQEISPVIDAAGSSTKVVVSIAAGITLEAIEGALPNGTRVVRCMPNTPCLVGEAAVGFARGKSSIPIDGDITRGLFTGRILEVGEKDIDAVTAVSGSGPAYVFLFIESLADAGVRAGILFCNEHADPPLIFVVFALLQD